MVIKADAAAKINLYLDITAIRSDGYHDIESVNRTVSLYDTVAVDFDGGGFYMTTDGVSEPMERTNTVVTAIRRFEAALTEVGCNSARDCDFSKLGANVTKRIPSGAGLGGGSADAAAVLLLLNCHLGEPFDMPKLCDIGKSIGADVPFCIMGGMASCQGIGEVLTPLHSDIAPEIVIAIGDSRVSTAWAYSEYDRLADSITQRGDFSAFVETVKNGGDISGSLYNVFESVVFPCDPIPRTLKRKMLALGASGALMSGSGTSVFGLFDDAESADWAKESLLGDGYKAFRCAFCK